MNPALLNGILAQQTQPQSGMPAMPPQSLAEFNRAQGIATGMSAQPQGLIPPQAPQAGGAPGMSAQAINEIYGLLAENAENPTAMMTGYVGQMQNQQQYLLNKEHVDRLNTPMEQMMRIYGKVNPYDWSAPSLQKFHDNWQRTGNMQFDLLEPKEGLSTTEETAILEANTEMQNAEGKASEIGSLIGRYEDAIKRGGYTQGVAGAASTWIAENITGNIDQYDALKKDFNNVINTGIINNLPPGVASDRDISIVKQGFPGANSDPAYLLSFLRGMQKLSIMESARHYHTATFLGVTKSPEHLTQNWNQTKNEMYLRALRDAGLEVVQLEPGETPETAARRALEQYSTPGTASIAPADDVSRFSNASDTELDSMHDAPLDDLINRWGNN